MPTGGKRTDWVAVGLTAGILGVVIFAIWGIFH